MKQLKIMNEPKYCKIQENSVIVHSKEETDFGLKTHYRFEVMNGHVFYKEIFNDFVAEVSLRMDSKSTYAQAGFFVMLSEKCWLKTSLEYIPEGHHI